MTRVGVSGIPRAGAPSGGESLTVAPLCSTSAGNLLVMWHATARAPAAALSLEQRSSGPLTTKHFPNIFGSEICRLDKWLPELGICSAVSLVNFRVDNKEKIQHQTKMSYISTARNLCQLK